MVRGNVDDSVHQLPNEILLKKLLNFLWVRLAAWSRFHLAIPPCFSIQFHHLEHLDNALFCSLGITVESLIGCPVDTKFLVDFGYNILSQLVIYETNVPSLCHTPSSYTATIHIPLRFNMAWVTSYFTLASLMSWSATGSFFLFIIPCHTVRAFLEVPFVSTILPVQHDDDGHQLPWYPSGSEFCPKWDSRAGDAPCDNRSIREWCPSWRSLPLWRWPVRWSGSLTGWKTYLDCSCWTSPEGCAFWSCSRGVGYKHLSRISMWV